MVDDLGNGSHQKLESIKPQLYIMLKDLLQENVSVEAYLLQEKKQR